MAAVAQLFNKLTLFQKMNAEAEGLTVDERRQLVISDKAVTQHLGIEKAEVE